MFALIHIHTVLTFCPCIYKISLLLETIETFYHALSTLHQSPGEARSLETELRRDSAHCGCAQRDRRGLRKVSRGPTSIVGVQLHPPLLALELLKRAHGGDDCRHGQHAREEGDGDCGGGRLLGAGHVHHFCAQETVSIYAPEGTR